MLMTNHGNRGKGRKHPKGVTAMNVKTKKVIQFGTIDECARYFKTYGSYMRWCVKKTLEGIPYKNHFFTYTEGEGSFPVAVNKSIRVYKRARIPVTITNVITGKVITCSSLSDAARTIGCDAKCISDQIKKTVATPYKGWYVRRTQT